MKISSLLMRLIRRLKLSMTIRSRTVKIYRVSISETKLSSIPEDERVFFIQSAYLVDELSFLLKLLFFANGKSEVEEEQRGLFTQHIFVARMLAGTLSKGWQILEKSFFGSGISVKYESQLEESVRSDLKELKRYFGRKNIIREIRNKFSYHHDANEIRNELSLVPSGSGYDIYLAKNPANSLYCIAQEIAGLALLRRIKEVEQVDDIDDAYARLFSDVESVSKKFRSVLKSCLELIVKTSLGQELENAKAIDVGEPAKMDDIRLPFFVEPPAK